jgi:DNA-binding transcriptional MerR regulator
MLSISQLGRRFGLSRSTLLYYDAIGLLKPRTRSAANYRQYSDADVARMQRIEVYRKAGLPLKQVARVLEADRGTLAGVLEARLASLGGEIQVLRRQQQLLVALLRTRAARRAARALDKAGWVAILRAAGMDERDMQRWHVEFEALAPEAHQDFLESLGLGALEVRRIRRSSRQARSAPRRGRRRR